MDLVTFILFYYILFLYFCFISFTDQEWDDKRIKEDLKKNCTTIDYFSTEKYQPDPTDSDNESTNVIPCKYKLRILYFIYF